MYLYVNERTNGKMYDCEMDERGDSELWYRLVTISL